MVKISLMMVRENLVKSKGGVDVGCQMLDVG
jgi:hypothetical protein